MRHQVSTLIGKGIQYAARLRGGGSALPGLVIEKIDPNFVARTLAHLPRGIVIVSGTNGKTTTTKMVVALLESQGLRVFTNPTGSNFIRGVAAALIDKISSGGTLTADIAVLELDEAHAVHFVKQVLPRYSLLLNVMRDQLDRFGEIDHTASLLHAVAAATTEGVVINRDDPRLSSPAFRDGLQASVYTYGVSPKLKPLFPSDDNMRSDLSLEQTRDYHSDDVQLERVGDEDMTISYDGASHDVQVKLRGAYNLQNAAGAVALTKTIMGEQLDSEIMLRALSLVTPAFGRGEAIMVDEQPCELVLVKNPAGFRLSLASFQANGHATMIAINDDYADGRDMSWLWDVDFDSLDAVETVSGVRAYDMALRLEYDQIRVGPVDTDIETALDHFFSVKKSLPKRIYCTYTAMLAIRKSMSRYAKVERVL
ncbi:MAG: MurT ligase domain-containing protein [Candidatus Saccharimonas sp.]